MAVTFCGHAQINYSEEITSRLLAIIKKSIQNGEREFLLGGYGNFDNLSAYVLKSLKNAYPDIRLTLVIPYLNRKFDMEMYDETIYPPIEETPKRFAILKRNEYMIDMSDIVIAYVEHDWGGAAKTLSYAYRKRKTVINLA